MARRCETPLRSTTGSRVSRAALCARGAGLALAISLTACAGGGAGTNDRYPDNRPEAPRSASDDEVLGASRQDPADTLEGSLTTEHAAPRSPHAGEPEAEAAHERLEYEQCIEQSKTSPSEASAAEAEAAGAEAPGEPRKRPVCLPPSPENAD